MADVRTVSFSQEQINHAFGYPYVSNSFPFGGKGAKHIGPMKKLLIENKQHEARVRGIHGFVGENRVCGTDATLNKPTGVKFGAIPKGRTVRRVMKVA